MTAAAVIDGRCSRRSNVFLAAVLQLAGSSFPVRIRNLSPHGALIDGKDLPREDDAVRLQRGPYSVVARVVWCEPQTCGLRFSSIVPVQEWIAYGSGHKGQQCVDEMIAQVRAGAAVGDAADGGDLLSPGEIERTAEQLEIISEHIAEIAAQFASLPAVAKQGLVALQRLDVARQKLADLSATIRGGGGQAAGPGTW